VLKQRLLTAAVLLPIFLAALFLMNTLYFALFLLVVLILSLNEWANISTIKSSLARVIYIAMGVAIVVMVQYYELAGKELFIFVFLMWLLVIVRLFRFETKKNEQEGPTGNNVLAWFDGYFVLLPTILGLEILKAQDSAAPQLLLVFFFIIWSADTGAYLAGRSLGKHKLAPRISPGKTIEGLIGGLVGAVTVAAIVGVMVWQLPTVKLIFWLLAVALITLLSVAGDLFESAYKRRAGVKDSGGLLPGHGGVLDRIDSACAALPPYMLVLYLFGFLAPGFSA
jgi:phosphatidate cytidylyltransferase